MLAKSVLPAIRDIYGIDQVSGPYTGNGIIEFDFGTAQISGVTAGNASGASRDFFLSVLKSNVAFPSVNGVVTPEAMAGFWLNWRDRLVAK